MNSDSNTGPKSMAGAWPNLVQIGRAPNTIKRIQVSKQENLSLRFREALTPMALVRQLKKLRQENTSLRRRLLMQTD
jgi:hypothetical protein